MGITGKAIDKYFEALWQKDSQRIEGQTPAKGVEQLCDICYIGDGKKTHLLDIYYPLGTDKSLPVIFDIHGGAWIYGRKEINKNFCIYLASRGFTVVNINYTLGMIREQEEDIFYAFSWLMKNAEKYHADMNNFFLAGDSAGGQLALLAALIAKSEKLRRIYKLSAPEFEIRAIGSICSAHDISMFSGHANPICREFIRRIYGDDFMNSPYIYCSSIKDIIGEAKLPPVFAMSSTEDFLYKMSFSLEKLFRKNGTEYEFRRFEKGVGHKLEHVFNVLHPEWNESVSVNNDMLRFFKKHMV